MLFVVVCAKEAGTAEVGRVLQGGGWRAKSSVGGISTNPPPPGSWSYFVNYGIHISQRVLCKPTLRSCPVHKFV